MPKIFILVFSLAFSAGTNALEQVTLSSPSEDWHADRVFTGSNIITMDENDTAGAAIEAVGIRDGVIIFTGQRSGVNDYIGPATEVIELGDHALLPGFIDAHGHLSFLGDFLDGVNLYSPPQGSITSIDEIISALRRHISESNLRPGQWVVGWGYDQGLLQEKRHPTRTDLDKVSTVHPIYLRHSSGHIITTNTAALDATGYDANSPDPDGGVIRRFAGTTIPNGVIEERAQFAVVDTARAAMGYYEYASAVDRLTLAMNRYLSLGTTTIQDGALFGLGEVDTLRRMASEGKLKADVVAYPLEPIVKDLDHFESSATYTERFRIGGIKFSADGAPQGRTAWMTTPYKALPDGASHPYYAYPHMKRADYLERVCRALKNPARPQVMTHANGDAAIDLVLDGIEECFKAEPIPDHRSVIVHAQMMRPDQLVRAKRLGAIPSFFSSHTYYWGDWHRISFGADRASTISPTNTALRVGLPFTIHHDTPIVPPDSLHLLWATVNRVTRSGNVIGPDERIPVEEALKALTINAAYQYFEEDKKGSITTGKQADLVILDRNPLTVDPMSLRDIAVLETISRGETVFLK